MPSKKYSSGDPIPLRIHIQIVSESCTVRQLVQVPIIDFHFSGTFLRECVNLGSDRGRSTGVTTNMRPSFKFRLRWVVWLQRKSFHSSSTAYNRYNKYTPKLQVPLKVNSLVTTKMLTSFKSCIT
jgi:hypothetical protein